MQWSIDELLTFGNLTLYISLRPRMQIFFQNCYRLNLSVIMLIKKEWFTGKNLSALPLISVIRSCFDITFRWLLWNLKETYFAPGIILEIMQYGIDFSTTAFEFGREVLSCNPLHGSLNPPWKAVEMIFTLGIGTGLFL